MKTILTLVSMLTIGINGSAFSEPEYCGRGDPIVGQYIGAHPDGKVQTQLIIHEGGTAVFSDELFIGSSETWTGGFNSPLGTVATGGHITWDKIKGGLLSSYKMAITLLAAGTLSDLNGKGTFPSTNFLRIYGTGTMELSKDCKDLKLRFNGCVYAPTDLSFASPSNCVSPVELDMVKVPMP